MHRNFHKLDYFLSSCNALGMFGKLSYLFSNTGDVYIKLMDHWVLQDLSKQLTWKVGATGLCVLIKVGQALDTCTLYDNMAYTLNLWEAELFLAPFLSVLAFAHTHTHKHTNTQCMRATWLKNHARKIFSKRLSYNLNMNRKAFMIGQCNQGWRWNFLYQFFLLISWNPKKLLTLRSIVSFYLYFWWCFDNQASENRLWLT